ncbi:MAG TPA: circadian clock protein KaiC [Polyangiaceae bacterium]|nr:circadian clock protein KaiC [Polyangiaceae bacterium]
MNTRTNTRTNARPVAPRGKSSASNGAGRGGARPAHANGAGRDRTRAAHANGARRDRARAAHANGGRATRRELQTIAKCPTGISGLDEVTFGGLPRGRPTLVCGGAGCGKTLMSVEFLVRGVVEFDEPGVFVSFEESEDEIAKNVASLGFDLPSLVSKRKLAIEHIRVERSEIAETGEYDLEGLFIRLQLAFDTVGAKRVVLDTIESLFGGLSDTAILRAELRRLFRWLKERGVTAVVTAERGDGALTRQGLEEYVSDCVILLDNRVVEQLTTRRLRIVKYRGSFHGTNEFPFLIDETGISVLPVTALALDHEASTERVSSGIPRLDAMLGAHGYYRGSSILVSGTAGTGKSSIAAHFANATCAAGERCLYFAFEESESQILRNTRSIGIDLKRWVDRGLLRFVPTRPTSYGLEMHLAVMHKCIDRYDPHAVVVDPMTNLSKAGTRTETNRMLLRLVDHLKTRQTTALFTNLTRGGGHLEATESEVSSIMDTWLLLRDTESSGERNRVLYVLKSRGMAHSNQVREFRLTDDGVQLLDVYVGPGGVLTGAARMAQEAREAEEDEARRQEFGSRERALEQKRVALEAQIAALRGSLAAEEAELAGLRRREQQQHRREAGARAAIADRRWADRASSPASRSPHRNGRP